MQLEDGHEILVTELGESPLEALAAHVRLVPQPAPDPDALGADEVLVRVRSAAVGWVDLLMTSGQYQHVPRPPYRPGLEYAGEIVAGGRATTIAPGTRVLIDGFSVGPRSSGAYQRAGGFATYSVVPERATFAIPGRLDLDQAASLLASYETAYHCLVARGRLAAGESVLVLGASGATGLAAVEIAKLLGARVIAAGRSRAKLAAAADRGADVTLELPAPGAAESLRDLVRVATHGKGVEVVYDPVGGPLSTEALRTLGFGGRFLVVGWAATPAVARGKGGRGAPNANLLPTNLVMMKSLDVLGCPTVIATEHDPTIRVERLRRIFEWVEADRLHPLVSATFPLAEFERAMRGKWAGEFAGAVCLRP